MRSSFEEQALLITFAFITIKNLTNRNIYRTGPEQMKTGLLEDIKTFFS
jgi:hypothetical protein